MQINLKQSKLNSKRALSEVHHFSLVSHNSNRVTQHIQRGIEFFNTFWSMKT